jgi:hypothetical protein
VPYKEIHMERATKAWSALEDSLVKIMRTRNVGSDTRGQVMELLTYVLADVIHSSTIRMGYLMPQLYKALEAIDSLSNTEGAALEPLFHKTRAKEEQSLLVNAATAFDNLYGLYTEEALSVIKNAWMTWMDVFRMEKMLYEQTDEDARERMLGNIIVTIDGFRQELGNTIAGQDYPDTISGGLTALYNRKTVCWVCGRPSKIKCSVCEGTSTIAEYCTTECLEADRRVHEQEPWHVRNLELYNAMKYVGVSETSSRPAACAHFA